MNRLKTIYIQKRLEISLKGMFDDTINIKLQYNGFAINNALNVVFKTEVV